jgi:hypothetical protein
MYIYVCTYASTTVTPNSPPTTCECSVAWVFNRRTRLSVQCVCVLYHGWWCNKLSYWDDGGLVRCAQSFTDSSTELLLSREVEWSDEEAHRFVVAYECARGRFRRETAVVVVSRERSAVRGRFCLGALAPARTFENPCWDQAFLP